MRPILLAAVALAGCSAATTQRIDAVLVAADQRITHFCRVQQPIFGRLAKVTAAGVAAATPDAAAAVPVAGMLVALADGTCAGIGGVDTDKPAEGTAVVVKAP